MDKFKNKYRIPSARLQTWDYGANSAYFITICTHNREHFFGSIPKSTNDEMMATQYMHLNKMGELAEQFWLEIPIHFPFVELGNFVVMPNHTHGILIIDKNANIPDSAPDSFSVPVHVPLPVPYGLGNDVHHLGLDAMNRVSTVNTPKKIGGFAGNKNPMLHKNISRIIRWYKGRCSFEIHKIHHAFDWQPSFHDHIIRDPRSFENIQNYIANNPANWNKDKFY